MIEQLVRLTCDRCPTTVCVPNVNAAPDTWRHFSVHHPNGIRLASMEWLLCPTCINSFNIWLSSLPDTANKVV